MLGTLWKPPKGTQKLERHILSNEPHLVRPQLAQKVTGTHTLWVMSNYIQTVSENTLYIFNKMVTKCAGLRKRTQGLFKIIIFKYKRAQSRGLWIKHKLRYEVHTVCWALYYYNYVINTNKKHKVVKRFSKKQPKNNENPLRTQELTQVVTIW